MLPKLIHFYLTYFYHSWKNHSYSQENTNNIDFSWLYLLNCVLRFQFIFLLKGHVGTFGGWLLSPVSFNCFCDFWASEDCVSFYSTVMWNHGSNAGLLLLFLSAVCWNFLSSCLAQDVHHLHCCEAAVGVDSPRMALRYTARQLLNLNGNLNLANDTCSLQSCRKTAT